MEDRGMNKHKLSIRTKSKSFYGQCLRANQEEYYFLIVNNCHSLTDRVDIFITQYILYLCCPLKLTSNLEAPRFQHPLKSKFKWGEQHTCTSMHTHTQ